MSEEVPVIRYGFLNRKVGRTEGQLLIFDQEAHYLFWDGTIRTTSWLTDDRPYWRTEAAWRVTVSLEGCDISSECKYAFEVRAIAVRPPPAAHTHAYASTSTGARATGDAVAGTSKGHEANGSSNGHAKVAKEERVVLLFVAYSDEDANNWVEMIQDVAAVRMNNINFDLEEDEENEEMQG